MGLVDHLIPYARAIVFGLTGAWALHAFYRAVRFRWPESYIGSDDAGLYRLLASPSRYAAFRAAPVYVVCAVIAVSAERASDDPALAVASTVVIHALRTNVRALVLDWRRGPQTFRHRLPIVAVRLGGLAAMAGAGTAALSTRGQVAGFVPPLSDMASNLFTALTAGVIGAYLVKVSADGAGLDGLIARSRSQISPEYWQLAADAAQLHGSDPALVRAVMLVENIQRPPWIRRLERAKGAISPAGTYGIMQVRADGVISDQESIRKAAEMLAGEKVYNDQGYVDSRALLRVAAKYNPDPGYPEMLRSALYTVRDEE